MSGRYLRANTSPKAKCPTCGEWLLFLRWCHEERCEAFQSRRRLRAAGIAVMLLSLVLALFLPVGA